MLTGEYRNTIDEKGRILIPARLRSSIAGNTLIVTRSIEKNLWMMLPDMWTRIKEQITGGPGAMFNSQTRTLQRRIIAPAQECEIDKAGRINIPPGLRDSVDLQPKQEAVILGIDTYLELWNTDEYAAFLERSDSEFEEAAESLGRKLEAAGFGK
ncbi:MAG: division/cell wall cluster transcriptional repressor MraZ [Spirochaetales bacterium]|nr:division/cell wall cluster transcriptional repressor MraZ [Spirochaetales bacterium]